MTADQPTRPLDVAAIRATSCVVSPLTATEPEQRIHGVNSFICGDGGCIVSFNEKPERSIAGALLEDAGDWLGALRNLERRNVPDGVMSAVEAAHEAVANWVDWLERTEAFPPA